MGKSYPVIMLISTLSWLRHWPVNWVKYYLVMFTSFPGLISGLINLKLQLPTDVVGGWVSFTQ